MLSSSDGVECMDREGEGLNRQGGSVWVEGVEHARRKCMGMGRWRLACPVHFLTLIGLF